MALISNSTDALTDVTIVAPIEIEQSTEETKALETAEGQAVLSELAELVVPDSALVRLERRKSLALQREERVHSQSNLPKRQAKKYNQEKIRKSIENSAPSGTLVTKISFGGHAPRRSTFQIALVRVVAPERVQDEALKDWERELTEQFGILVHVSRVTQNQLPIQRLNKYADSETGLLQPGTTLPSKSVLLYGAKAPRVNPYDEMRPPPCAFRDLRHLQFQAVDPEDCNDPEDAFYVEELSSGNIAIYQAIADVARVVRKDTDRAAYLMRSGHSAYGSRESVHNIGDLHEVTSLHEGKDRFAFILYGEHTPGGDTVSEDLYCGLINNKRQLTTEQGRDLLVSGSDDQFSLAAEVVHKLRSSRLATTTTIDYGRGGRINRVIEELAIFSYHTAAKVFDRKNTQVIHRIHTLPSKLRLKALYAKVRGAGVSAKFQDLTDPMKCRKLLQKLQDEGLYPLVSEMIDTIQVRGRNQVVNWGHYHLRVDYYAQMKARKLQGWINQVQAHQMLGGPPGFSLPELRKMQILSNQKERASVRKTYELLAHEEVEQMMRDPAKDRVAEVGELNGYGLRELLSTGLLNKVLLDEPPESVRKGDLVQVDLTGIDTVKGALLFKQSESLRR